MSLQKEYESYLAHYGVLGMKWGVRKQSYQVSKDRKRALKRRKIMSTKELDKRISRLEKEKKLRELTDSEVAPGRKAVKDFFSNYGKKVALGAFIGATAYGVYAFGKGFYKKKNTSQIKWDPKRMSKAFDLVSLFETIGKKI